MTSVTTSWTAATSTTLDRAAGDVINESNWDALVSNVNFLGGSDGYSGEILSKTKTQQSQIVNEIKNWPPYVGDNTDLVTGNLWWDDVGVPGTKGTVVTTSGAGLTQTYKHAIKVIASGSVGAPGDGVKQTFTYSEEPRVKSGRTISAMIAVWSVGGATVSAKLINSDLSATAGNQSATAAAWTIITIEGHVCAGTSVDLQVYTVTNSATFYVVPLGLNVGTKAWPLGNRPVQWMDVPSSNVVNNANPASTGYVDVDLTAATDALAFAAQVSVWYYIHGAAGRSIFIRRNGDANNGNANVMITAVTTGAVWWINASPVYLDDANIFEYNSDAATGTTQSIYMHTRSYWRWG